MVDARQRRHTQRLQAALVDHQQAAGAVADLAGVGRADHAAGLQQLDRRDRLQRHVEADAFIHRMQLAVCGTVLKAHRQRHDLIAEPPGLRRCDGTLVAEQREGVQVVARQPVLARQRLGPGKLAEGHVAITRPHPRAQAGAQPGLLGQRAGREHRHPRHRLHPTGNDDVHRPGHHRLRREVQRLLRGAALPVDRRRGHRLRQPRRQHRIARHVARLLPRLPDAAPYHVINGRRVHPAARHQRIDHRRRQIHRMPAAQAALAFATRGAQGGDDEGVGHRCLLGKGERLWA